MNGHFLVAQNIFKNSRYTSKKHVKTADGLQVSEPKDDKRAFRHCRHKTTKKKKGKRKKGVKRDFTFGRKMSRCRWRQGDDVKKVSVWTRVTKRCNCRLAPQTDRHHASSHPLKPSTTMFPGALIFTTVMTSFTVHS